MPNKNKKKILVIDDDPSVLDMYLIALKSAGFEVLSAPNGKEGLKKAISKTPDLILLDILMPVMDGFSMLQKLRSENEYGKNVPVILLTNLSAGGKEDIIEKIAKTEPVNYIVKISVTPEEVVKKIKERLEKINS